MRHQFVEHIPEALEPGVLYVSIGFDTAIHSCACGCGNEVVTPLSPAQWSMTYDGRSVSLHPSIGNWNFPCKSHYWIRKGRIEWSTAFSESDIAEVKSKDVRDLAKLHGEKRRQTGEQLVRSGGDKGSQNSSRKQSFLSRILDFLR